MCFNHKKYPIIIGAEYINEDDEIGTLYYCELFDRRHDALICINMNYKGQYYKLNYATFCFDWKLKRKK